MEPVAYGFMAMLAGAIVIALLIGAVGGVINGRLNGDLALGAIATMGAYLLVAFFQKALLVVRDGMLPLMVTFLLGSLATRYLETHLRLRPMFATPAAFGIALLAGFLYALPLRFGSWRLANPRAAWIALAILLCLIVLSIRKRTRRKGA